MYGKILELKEQRANLSTEMRAILDSFDGKEMDQEKKNEYRKMEDQFSSISERILAEERQIERERLAGEIQKKVEAEPKDEKRSAFRNYLVSQNDAEYRALQQDNATQAGYLVAPMQFVNELITDIDNMFHVRQLSRKFTLNKAQSLGFPKKTARMSVAAWGTEIEAPTADTALAFGRKEFKPNPLTAEILVSRTLIRNSAIDAESIIRAEMAYAFGRALETAYMTGSGAGQPLGLFTASSDGISTSRDVSTGNTTTEIKFDGLFEAKYKLPQQYQSNLNWIFHRDAVKQIAKLKDGEGQYIWQPSVVANTPDMLLGIPVTMSEYAPNTFTTGLYVGLLGDMSQYWIVDALNMEMQALQELYARTNQIDYIARMETDAMPVLEEAFVRVKLA